MALPGARDDQRIQRVVERIESRRAAAEARMLRRFARKGVPADLVMDHARATAAMTAVQLVPRLKAKDQVHARVQALTIRLLEDVGRGVYAMRDLLRDAVEAEEGGPIDMDAAFAQVDEGLNHEEVLTPAGRRVAGHTLAELKARLRDEGIHGVSRRELRRMERMCRVAEAIAEGGRAELLAPADPELLAQLDEAKAWWGPLGAEPRDPAGLQALLILGLIASGLAVLAAGYVVLVTIVCALSCEAPGLLIIALLGAVLIVLLILGMVAIVRRLSQRGGSDPRPRRLPEERPEPGRQPVVPPTDFRDLPPAEDPLARPAREYVRTRCVGAGYAIDGPECAAQMNAAASAIARGMPLADIGRAVDYLPEFTLLEVTLAWTRKDAQGSFAPDPALGIAKELYQRKGWTLEVGNFRADVAAIAAAMGRGAGSGAILLAIESAPSPGRVASALADVP